MSNRSSELIGMPPPANFVSEGDKLSDTIRGNPLGDRVDTSSGDNVQKSVQDPKRQASGHSLRMYSKPSWLCQ
jgi:hypothetical protein